LKPPSDVNEGVREINLLDVVEDVLFLWKISAATFQIQRLTHDIVDIGRSKKLTVSLSNITPLGGATVMKEHGTKRPTPAFLAASTSGIWSVNTAALTVDITTSAPVKS
jgi:hypothetical protein